MGISITTQAKSALKQTAKEPNIVLEIEGLNTVFGASLIQQYVRIGGTYEEPGPGDPVPEIGDPETNDLAFYIGGFNLVEDQDDIITFEETSTSIRSSLQIDKGEGSSISALNIALMDDGYVTRLLTPGEILDDLLQRRCKVYMGFTGTAWPEDYITIFRGVITDVMSSAGKSVLQLNHPDEKKRSNIFKLAETNLFSAIDSSQTSSITLANSTNFLTRILGPDGSYDSSFLSYVRIDDEIIQYTGISSNVLTGVTRGALGTTASSHAEDAPVSSYYRLKGNGVYLALKLMLSGWNGPYLEEVDVDGVNISGAERVENALFFKDIDVTEKYGLTEGDYVSLVNDFLPANDFTDKRVSAIIKSTLGDFVQIEGVTLTDDNGKYSQASFRSQFDTLPDGLKMYGDEVDIAEHLRIYRLFLSSVEYDFYLKEGIENAREFLDQYVYSPMAAYSIPRKSRSSLGYHIGPIPGQDIATFNDTNVKNPSKVKIRRSTSKQFYNEVIYRWDEDPLEDKYYSGYIAISQNSKNRIPGGNKSLFVEAKGLRSENLANNIAQEQTSRRLKRYEYGAEAITFDAFLDDSFGVEIGDIIIFDGTKLKLPDSKTGAVGMAPRFFEIQNKEFQIKTGDVRFEAVDTNFSGAARYGLISPASIVKSGISTTSFVIESSFASRFGAFEYRKWQSLVGCQIQVRNADFSTVLLSTLTSASSNTIQVSPAFSSVPTDGMVMELATYNTATDNAKLVYVFMSDDDFDDGKTPFDQL
jgi:hypothetical protein